MDTLAKRLFFRSAIRKNWIPLWVRWRGQTRRFTGGQDMVQASVLTSTLIPATTHSHALSGTTRLLQQCRTRPQSWPGLSTSHLMRWRYFILTLLNKYKKNHFINYGQETCSYINILTTFKKCTFQCIFLDNVENLSSAFFSWFLLNTRKEFSTNAYSSFFFLRYLIFSQGKENW